MSDKNEVLAAMAARLDALSVSVERMAAALEAHGVVLPGGAQAREPNAPSALKAPTDEAPEPTQAPTQAPSDNLGEVIVDEHVVRGVPMGGAGFKLLLSRMFEAVLKEDIEEAWLDMTALMHPRELVAPRALDSLKAFSWKQLRKNASAYLNDDEPGSFSIVRTDPTELRGDEERIKVFLNARGRSPAPLTLKRDASADGAWRLGQVSL